MRLFDPMGFMACITIRAKILLQDVWRSQTDWDQKIPAEYENRWDQWKELLSLKWEIPRCIKLKRSNVTHLHTFCDASETACCAVVYALEKGKDNIHVAFVAASAKWPP
jgi:hypothetical protein